MNLIIYTIDGGQAYLETDKETIEDLKDALNNQHNDRFIVANNQNGNELLINTRYITAIEKDD